MPTNLQQNLPRYVFLAKVVILSVFNLFFLLTAQGKTSSSDNDFLVTINAPHRARIIDDDMEAFYNYLQMIGRARKSIELETFVFNPDKAGKLILQALVKKADEGVKIRILVDYYSNGSKPGLDGFYHDALSRHGIELRYFNVAHALEFWIVGFRNHRKLLVVDGKEMFVGGRNISDSYFGMDKRVNYLDRDVWLEGPIAQKAIQNFNLYWQSSIVSIPKAYPPPTYKRSEQILSSKHPKTVAQDKADFAAQLAEYRNIVERAQKALIPQPEDEKLKTIITKMGGPELVQSPIVQVPSVTLVSDKPIPGDEGRMVFPYLLKRLEKTQHSLLIENFIFLCKDEEKDMFLSLLKRKVQIELLTNSFLSEPNFVLAELTNSRQNMAVENGMNVFCYMSVPPPDGIFRSKTAIWGLHTKNMLIDGRDSVVGSFNLDPRSAQINDEIVVIINDSPEFASLIEKSIRKRIKNATRMHEDGSYANGYHCYSSGRILTIILRPLVEIFTDFL